MVTSPVQDAVAPDAPAEELRLWADYYETIARVLELVRPGLTTPATLPQILDEHAKASAVIQRIKEIRGVKDST